ncbi:hypothetical protein O3P69_020815 [Scylla paramamosain]|uniref:protein-tyrosine-phosphatase n=1 Tax=Scylla paramamosain TaxID=85552 RepID=A0AAW0TR57_SCYPA
MAAPSTRWLCLLRPLFFLLLLQGSRVAGQLTIGSADSFLPEHLDAKAVSTTGKTIDITPLSDASVTNAAADAAADAAAAETASDANSPVASEAGDYLFTPTDSPSEDTTLPDFDDYTVDETETTTKSGSPENDVIEPGKADLPDYLADGEQGDGMTTASLGLTRRIVFTGPDTTATTPLAPLESTRPSSVLRELNDPTTDLWLPNWPSHLLEGTKEFRRPSVRFPTGPPPTATLDTTLASPVTTSPSYTVTKVPVTQYYFDLASVNPTAIPGPLFDRESVTASSSMVPSVLPDVTQPLEPEDLPSSISELQSSVLVDAAEPPVTSTPALPPSTTSLVITTEALQSINPSATTETVPPTSTALNEVVEGHLDNTLTEETQAGDTTVKEIPETSVVMPSGSGSTQSGLDIDNSESTTTAEDPDSLFSPAVTSEAPQPTNISQPVTQSPTLPAPSTNTTDDPIPTLLPQPLHPEEGGEEETHEEMPGKEEAPESEMEPPPLPATPLPSPLPPDTTTPTTTTLSSTTSSSTTTTTTAPEKVPETEAPAVKSTTAAAPDTTTAFTSPEPAMNKTAAPGEMPVLTTTTVLDNGTEVVVALPYVRALVDYNAWEFCQRKHEFRSLFAEWITQDLNGSVRKVSPKDIRFFAMADCSSFPPSQNDQTEHEDAGSHDTTMQEKNHTHIYFYVTSAGEVDRELTEKFPLFPTDLVISEDLKYLVPRVMQLEVVRPDESSSQDQLQEAAVGTSVIVIIVICSIVGVTIIVALFFFMVVKRRGATNNYYGRRCTPVSMDAYSMDSVSVYHSFRRKSKRRASGRSMKSYLNQAFDDPNGPSRPLNFAKLTHFISDIDGVYEEFATIPVNMPKYDELPPGVEDKNRYANVIPVPETRVLLKVTKDGRNCEYINANFVRGARNESKYYIATQAPLDDTVADFWRMVWEQEARVVVMLTDFVEKGIDKCADYLPPSETLDCHRLYGDFQVTLKSRDMREKFVVSNVQLKNLENNLMREVAHMWFTGWPASGVPNEEGAFISFILEVRRTRKKLRAKGPIVVHCSPGTGRTGTLLASDIVMKQFEEHRTIDVPRTVYAIRRDRAGAVQTKEQYAFIYRVINLYASKLTSGNLESL